MLRYLRLTGILPGTITEGSRPGDWSGTLHLDGDLAGLTAVLLTGADALFLGARWDAASATIWLAPAAAVDAEALYLSGRAPVLSFGLAAAFSDGTQQALEGQYNLAVQGRDDTPPLHLSFASGGSITAGALGGVIGRLQAWDPDTTGPLLYQVPEADAWKFRIDGDVLSLQPGISLGLDDVPLLSTVITVSDGRQAAALPIDILVRWPMAEAGAVPLLHPGDSAKGFTLLPGGVLQTARFHTEIAGITVYDHDIRQIQLVDASQLWVQGVTRLQCWDGFYDFAADGPAAALRALWQAVLGHAPSAPELAQQAGALLAGTTVPVAVAQALLSGAEFLAQHAGLDDAAVLALLDTQALGHAPDAGLVQEQAWALAGGGSRAEAAVALALSGQNLARLAMELPDGIWVATGTASGGGQSLASLGRGELFL